MRITRKEYEKARANYEKLKGCVATVKKWEETVKNLDVGGQKILAIKIQDGKITTECETQIVKTE